MLRTMNMLKKDVSEKDKALRTANEALRSSEKQAEEVIGIRRASCRRNDCVGRLMRLVSGGGFLYCDQSCANGVASEKYGGGRP